MFEQTADNTFALIAARRALAGATLRRSASLTPKNVWRCALALFAVALAAAGASAQTGTPRVYVADYNAARVRVFDPTQPNSTPHQAALDIHVGQQPFGLVASPDGRRLYVSNYGSDSVSVIDTRWNMVYHNVPVGDGPYQVALSPDGTRLYVSNFEASSVTVVNVGVATSPMIERTFAVAWQPTGLAVSPDGSQLWVSQYRNHTLKVFETTNFTELGTIDVSAMGATQPVPIVFSPDGKRAYVANEGGGPNEGGTVSFINTANRTVERTVPLPYKHLPRGQMVITANGRHLYLPGAGQGRMLVIDTLTGDVLQPQTFIGVGPSGIAMSPNGARLYVGIEGNMLSTVDTAKLATPGQNAVLWETLVPPEVPGGTRFQSIAFVNIPSCP